MKLEINIDDNDALILGVYLGDIQEYLQNITDVKIRWATDTLFNEHSQYQAKKVLPDIKRAFAAEKAKEINTKKDAL